ncbi:MAG TPA: hypothetical protein VES20_12435, partial [Bryobacteraceae bacterium]|nr:hypothetical protein [Bryobacteraceae bacterium]
MPERVAPADLKLKLEVIASREASRRRETTGNRLAEMIRPVTRWITTAMQPPALPTAGGFASAMILFGLLSPSLALRSAPVSPADIPTGLYTGASIKSSLPLAYDGAEMLVELTVDEEGRMVE